MKKVNSKKGMKKAITPVLSILVLVLIVVGFSGSTWVFFSGFLGSKMVSVEAPPGTSVCRGTKAEILLVNSGPEDINISTQDMMLGQFQSHPDVIGAWKFDEEDGNVSVDSSGNGNDGTIYGDTLMLLHMDESSGLLAHDDTSYGNAGTLMNMDPATDWVAGRSGSALDFDGMDDYVDLGNDASLGMGTSDFTITAWIKTSQATEGVIVRADENAPLYIFGVFNGKLRAHINDGTTSVNDQDLNGPAVNDGEWHHVALVFDRDATFVFYKDGAPAAGMDISAANGNLPAPAQYSAIGKRPNTATQFFDGTIDEVAVYKRSLTAEEVKAQYDAGRARFIERVPGRFGYAFESDGSSDHSVTNPFSIPKENFTFSLWFKLKDDAISRGMGQYFLNSNGWNLYQHSANNLLYFYRGGARYISWVPSNNEWHHLACSVSDSGALGGPDYQAVCVGDGIQRGIHQAGYLDPASYFRVMAASNSLKGIIDEVTIVNSTMSLAEIQAQMTPACTCSGNMCDCGDVTVMKTAGDGEFFPYFSSAAIAPKQSVTMTDYSCLSRSCTYRIVTPAMSFDAVANCG